MSDTEQVGTPPGEPLRRHVLEPLEIAESIPDREHEEVDAEQRAFERFRGRIVAIETFSARSAVPATRSPLHEDGTTCEWAIRCQRHVCFPTGVVEICLVVVPIIKHLIGDDRGIRDSNRLFELFGREVARADLRDQILFFERLHCRERLLEGDSWMREVHQQKVDVFEAETVETLANRLDHVVVPEIRSPNLGRREDLLSIHVRGGDPLAH